MTKQEIIERARAAIGAAVKGDLSVAPPVHAGALPEEAKALADLLRGEEAKAAATRFATCDREAIDAGKRFRRTSMRAAWSVFVTGLAGAALLFAGSLDGQGYPKLRAGLLVAFGVVSLISGVIAGTQARIAREQQYIERWMRKRAAAEADRVEYFRLIAAAEGEESPASGIPLALLKLEYVRRYELEAQLRFYTGSAERHRRESDRTMNLGAVAVVVGAVSAGLAALLAGLVQPSLAALAMLGVVGSGLSAVATAREGVFQSRINADRYEVARDALVGLAGKLDKVRREVADGKVEALTHFVDALTEALMSEQKQWLTDAQKAGGALEALEKTLAGIQASAPASASAPRAGEAPKATKPA